MQDRFPNAERTIRGVLNEHKLTSAEVGELRTVFLAEGKKKVRASIRDAVALTVSLGRRPCGEPFAQYEVDLALKEDVADSKQIAALQEAVRTLLDDIRRTVNSRFGLA